MKRNLETLLTHLYYSSVPCDYWAERLFEWHYEKVPALALLQQIYDDWTAGIIELSGIELNEFQELWICDPDEIIDKRNKDPRAN